MLAEKGAPMNDTQPTKRQPRCGALAPDFTLPDALRPGGAEPVRLRAWRQRSPALIALLPSAAAEARIAWLRALAARRPDLTDAHVVTLAILAGSHDDAQALLRQVERPYPLLVDADGETMAAYLGATPSTPTLALVDRYSILLALIPPLPNGGPDLDAALREFAFAEQDDCACGLPAWEAE